MALRRAAATLAYNVVESCSAAAGSWATAGRAQGSALAQGTAAAATAGQQLQQARPYIAVDVPNGNVDKALRTLTRKLKEERYMLAAQSKDYFIKPSDRRKMAAAESRKKFRKQEFREMLQWIIRRKSRGF